MEDEIVQKLLALNRAFYREFAEPFAQTRAEPQPGFSRLRDFMTLPYLRFLDVGCGEGRFGRFLIDNGGVNVYVGVDFSSDLLERAAEVVDGDYYLRDLSRTGCLADLGKFEGVACLATLQHIPGRNNRLRLMQEIGQHVTVDGRIFISTWQFVDSRRQRRKIVEWDHIGLVDKQLEPNDFLLSWQRDGFGLRYVSYIDAQEVTTLAQEAGLSVVDMFRSDGRESDLNLYAILAV